MRLRRFCLLSVFLSTIPLWAEEVPRKPGLEKVESNVTQPNLLPPPLSGNVTQHYAHALHDLMALEGFIDSVRLFSQCPFRDEFSFELLDTMSQALIEQVNELQKKIYWSEASNSLNEVRKILVESQTIDLKARLNADFILDVLRKLLALRSLLVEHYKNSRTEVDVLIQAIRANAPTIEISVANQLRLLKQEQIKAADELNRTQKQMAEQKAKLDSDVKNASQILHEKQCLTDQLVPQVIELVKRELSSGGLFISFEGPPNLPNKLKENFKTEIQTLIFSEFSALKRKLRYFQRIEITIVGLQTTAKRLTQTVVSVSLGAIVRDFYTLKSPGPYVSVILDRHGKIQNPEEVRDAIRNLMHHEIPMTLEALEHRRPSFEAFLDDVSKKIDKQCNEYLRQKNLPEGN